MENEFEITVKFKVVAQSEKEAISKVVKYQHDTSYRMTQDWKRDSPEKFGKPDVDFCDVDVVPVVA